VLLNRKQGAAKAALKRLSKRLNCAIVTPPPSLPSLLTDQGKLMKLTHTVDIVKRSTMMIQKKNCGLCVIVVISGIVEIRL